MLEWATTVVVGRWQKSGSYEVLHSSWPNVKITSHSVQYKSINLHGDTPQNTVNFSGGLDKTNKAVGLDAKEQLYSWIKARKSFDVRHDE